MNVGGGQGLGVGRPNLPAVGQLPILVGVNFAVSECVPAGSRVMRNAKPPTTGTGPAPSGVVPSMNWMVPLAPEGVTFARKSTGRPW
jgi:hypothetical protein